MTARSRRQAQQGCTTGERRGGSDERPTDDRNALTASSAAGPWTQQSHSIRAAPTAGVRLLRLLARDRTPVAQRTESTSGRRAARYLKQRICGADAEEGKVGVVQSRRTTDPGRNRVAPRRAPGGCVEPQTNVVCSKEGRTSVEGASYATVRLRRDEQRGPSATAIQSDAAVGNPAHWSNTHQLVTDGGGVRSGSEGRLPTSCNRTTSDA